MRKPKNKFIQKGDKKKSQPLPIEISEIEFNEILGVTKHMHHKVAFLLAWGSGLRISEVVNLQPEDIDFKTKQIRVNQGKGCKDRIVPVPKNLKEHHLKYIPIKCKQRALQKALVSACEKTGLSKKKPRVHFHSLRHGFATQCIRKGMRLPSLQRMLGHEDLTTTTLYINLVPQEILNEYYDKF